MARLKWPALVACAALALVVTAIVSFYAGFGAGISTHATRNAQSSSGVLALALSRIRDGHTDQGLLLLEGDLESMFIMNWAGMPAGDDLTPFGAFEPLPLAGMQQAARYLSENPRADRDDFVQAIIECHLDSQLPDPKSSEAAHRAAVISCYENVR